MTLVDVVLAMAFVWFVLRIEWPTEERDLPFDADDSKPATEAS